MFLHCSALIAKRIFGRVFWKFSMTFFGETVIYWLSVIFFIAYFVDYQKLLICEWEFWRLFIILDNLGNFLAFKEIHQWWFLSPLLIWQLVFLAEFWTLISLVVYGVLLRGFSVTWVQLILFFTAYGFYSTIVHLSFCGNL